MNPFGYNSEQLGKVAKDLRVSVISMLSKQGVGHSASALGLADIFATLFFHTLSYDPHDPFSPDRDRFILSAGHTCPILYATLAAAGIIDQALLGTYARYGSVLQGHPSREYLPFLENSSGPLAQGISQAVGKAIALAHIHSPAHVYCLASDGEHDEGQTWEAFLLAQKYQLRNITFLVDRNFIQIDGTTEDILPLESLREKYESFGLHVFEIDGNAPSEIIEVLQARQHIKKTCVILAYTTPGKGVSFIESKYSWHGRAPNQEESYQATLELRAHDSYV